MENKSSRISFAKDKITNFQKGATGITGTSKKATDPTGSIDGSILGLGAVFYNSSEQLKKSLDKLGEAMNLSQNSENEKQDSENIIDSHEEEIEQDTWNTSLDDLTEEEVIKNLNQHLGYRPAKVDLALRVDKNGQILPQNVIEPETFNGKAISQNVFIPDAPVSERKIIETSTKSIKDLFCRNCGSQYLETDNFCGGCGNKRN